MPVAPHSSVRCPKSLGKLGVLESFNHRLGKRSRLSGRDQKARFIRPYRSRHTAHIGGNHWHLRGKSLQNRYRVRFVIGRQAEHVESRQQSRNITSRSRKVDPILQPQLSHSPFNRRPFGSVTDHHKMCRGDMLRNQFGHIDKQRDNEFISKHNFEMPLHQVRPYVQHNVIFALLTEVGLLGTVPFLLLLGAWTRNAVRLWADHSVEFAMRAVSLIFLAYLVNYLVNGMFHDVALIQMMNLGLFFLAGLMMSICQSTRVTQAEELPTYETRPQSSSLTLT